ncbi:bifunctional heptose 7-phosphate kinase/heptose 1-phosphate adenyltransferase [Microcoleus sp. FACHB-1515]|uniref:PfkB family carbohydrate kinase n=1 Tax=Cyanophyceae TaxID=3028117 RepID=UPI0016894FF5|nr:PfkB family carbohydrate kinase [Microcoleus sp. FACHB-1515]MBD2091731.1 bifunctional heptose 7-phosphate kinase/heptose 1-phosphate adenyltransferase [Microcoleus sp. FACHB-1515]
MKADFVSAIDNWSGQNILVIGDAMLDCYLHGSAERLCPEAPVPVVAVGDRHDFPGGAANTAANVQSLGGQAYLLGVTGEDVEGNRLRQVLRDRGVNINSLVSDPQRVTIAKQRVLAAGHLLLRVDQGDTGVVRRSIEQQLIDSLIQHFPCCDGVIVSDYGYGVLTPRIIETLTLLQAQTPRPIVVDSKRLSLYRSIGVTAVKPNYAETVQLLGLNKLTSGRVEQIMACGDRLLTLTGAKIVAATLDQDGAIVFEAGKSPYRTYAQPVPCPQASGAGDTFVSTLALALVANAATATAASLAATATAIVVSQPETTSCQSWELRQFLLSDRKRVSTLTELVARIQRQRTQGKRIVLTNGCFDLLHQGHIAHLQQAKALGDILIVGVNTDETVRQLKGSDRPVNSLSDRLTILAALDCVDYVIPFAESTPCDLIRAIRPDLFTKGSNYAIEQLPEAPLLEELGGAIVILPFQGGSTASLIARIRQAAG